MPKRQLDRARIVKLVKNAKPGKYHPTINDVVFWYDNLNSQIFKNKLPKLTAIYLGRLCGYWAEADCKRFQNESLRVKLKLNKHLNSFKAFIEIIAHEMVHIWEFINFSVMGHGKRFFSWQSKLKQLGLDLNIKQ